MTGGVTNLGGRKMAENRRCVRFFVACHLQHLGDEK
jgi:hypothetical protein